jgi:hypothetical protein
MSVTTTRCGTSKRKAAEAALDAIQKIKLTEAEEDDDDDVSLDDSEAPSGGRLAHFCIGGGAALPEELAYHILGFVPKTDLVHSISLVSTLWNDLSKSTLLWQTLHFSKNGLKQSKKGLASMGRFIGILQRPQFASLKRLGFPDIYRTRSRNVFPKISKACPLLEEIDLATIHRNNNVGVRPFSEDMMIFPSIFPNLKKISLEMFGCNNRDSVERFVQAMDGRLVRLHLLAGGSMHEDCRCLDATLEIIGRSCPNLTSFSYEYLRCVREDNFEETVTDKGFIALLEACPKLKVCIMRGTTVPSLKPSSCTTPHPPCFQNLELVNLRKIGKPAFDYILQSSNLSRLCVFFNPALMNDSVMLGNLSDKLDLYVDEHAPRMVA